MRQRPSGSAEEGLMKGPWTEVWQFKNQHGASCRPGPGKGGRGGAARQGCSVVGPRLCPVEGGPGISTPNTSSFRPLTSCWCLPLAELS